MSQVFSSSDFEYKGFVLTAEASMLDYKYGKGVYFSDVRCGGMKKNGFIIQSAKTGATLTFVHSKTMGGDEESDGEIFGWEFKPVGKHLSEKQMKLVVKIFNT